MEEEEEDDDEDDYDKSDEENEEGDDIIKKEKGCYLTLDHFFTDMINEIRIHKLHDIKSLTIDIEK